MYDGFGFLRYLRYVMGVGGGAMNGSAWLYDSTDSNCDNHNGN